MAARTAHRILFNFAASPVGGGLKRLSEYAKWFDTHGGARFIIHSACESLRHEFPNNEFFVSRQSRASRVLGGADTDRHRRGSEPPDCYYAYGIPIDQRVGVVNWFHLSNVLPLNRVGVPMTLADRVKFAILGQRIRRSLPNADVISAESDASLALVDISLQGRLFRSVNGSDDELQYAASGDRSEFEAVATVVGTYRHKALGDSLRVFDMLKRSHPELRLQIFGDSASAPPAVAAHPGVEMMGNCPRPVVIAALKRSRYYISTTRIENSYNAAAEGMFFADEAYISDIGPHRELVAGMPYDRATIDGIERPLLHVRRRDVSTAPLKSWNEVVLEMLAKMQQELESKRNGSRTDV